MEVINKRYNHDHASAYKSRGEKLGVLNRFVRANKATKERKTLRRNELTKRRGITEINEQNTSIEEVKDAKKNVKGGDKNQAKVIEKENVSGDGQITDQRKAMLLKWREQKELKRKADAMSKSQKTVFAVRHIQYNDQTTLFPPPNTKHSKKIPSKPKENVKDKIVTRSSARLAAKIPNKPAVKERKIPTAKEVKTTRKAAVKQGDDQPKRVTRQSSKSTTASKPSCTNKKEKDESKKVEKEEENTEGKECLVAKKQSPEKKEKAQDGSSSVDQVREEPMTRSFAPSNFQFTAPSGLNSFENYSKEFKFQPLSPASAANFFQGVTSFPSPKRELITKDNFASAALPLDDVKSNKDQESHEDQESTSEAHKVPEKSDAPVINSRYFRNLVLSETARLNGLCDHWEKEMESSEELTEEVKGNIRTAVGQAQLLISQRFKQFSGLIDLSEDETAEKKATMTDLQGFWDMVYFQVEDVNAKLEELEKQKQNGWVVEEKITTKKKVKKVAPKKAEMSKTAKPSGKSKIQEIRAAMRAKMAEKKKQIQSQGVEESSFITVLTPVKKNKRLGSHGDIVLTPVRRSLRNTPINQLTSSTCTPKVVSTPKTISTTSPGLRLTPEVASIAAKQDLAINDSEMKEEKPNQAQEALELKDSEMQEEKPVEENNIPTQTNTESSNECTSGSTDEEMNDNKCNQSSKRRSCLRSSTKRTRKSSHVFFQSPEPSGHSTAGGTPGAIVCTPGLQSKKKPTGVIFTPVSVCFDSPDNDGLTCSTDAGHTPALPVSGSRSLRSRTSKGTPLSGRKRHIATPDVSLIAANSGTPVCTDEGSVSKRRSLRRRSAKKNSPSSDEETAFLPDKYILPSTSSESDDEHPRQHLTPLLVGKPKPSDNQEEQLLPFTPLKDSSSRINKSLTPASKLQALTLDDSLENRRDSVFFAQGGSLVDGGKVDQDNLICFSPLAM